MIAVLDVFLELKAEVDGLVGVVRLQKVAKVLDDDVRVVVSLKVVDIVTWQVLHTATFLKLKYMINS